MKVLHLNAGNETGGGMHHILLLLDNLNKEEIILGVFEEGELSRRAEALGIKVNVFAQSSRFDFSIINSILQFIENNDIEILHTHGPRANLFGALIKRKSKCKWVSTIHSDPRDDFLGQGLKGKVFTFLNIRSIRKADHLLAISDKFKDILIDRYLISEQKISTILNGIDFTITSNKPLTRNHLQIHDHDFVIIMVARLEKVKDHLTAFRALKETLDQGEQFKLILIGDGREKENLIKECESQGLSEQVKFLGHRNDVIDLYPLADVAMLTSRSESFPLVLLEAAREGLPLLSTNVGGVNKMIPSKEYGWIHEVGDYQSIGNSILHANKLKQEHSLKLMGEKVRQHCSGNFSIEKQAMDVYNAYKGLLDRE